MSYKEYSVFCDYLKFLHSVHTQIPKKNIQKEDTGKLMEEIEYGIRSGVLHLQSLQESDFGVLMEYIKKSSVTDINWNGTALWVDDLYKGRYKSGIVLSDEFLQHFSAKLSNVVSRQFNKYSPILEAETAELRISVIHQEVANTGTVLSIRKIPREIRMVRETMIDDGYCSDQIEQLLAACVKAKMNIIICGLPGVGKTELLKYLGGYIEDKERVITLEDNLELHFPAVYPSKDCVEFKVNDIFSYQAAIKASLRLLPTWLLVSEIRSTEVKYLLEAISTGTHCMSTIHAECVEMIPNRLKNMAGDTNRDWEEEAFRHIDVGVYIRKEIKEQGEITRHISQVCFFERKEERNVTTVVVDNGYVISDNIPDSKRKKFELYNVEIPRLEREVFYG